MSNHSIGTWLSLPNESVAEIFAKAGYEWVVIDLEHSAININQAEQLIRVIDLPAPSHLFDFQDTAHHKLSEYLMLAQKEF